jgi:hypothetical protein
MAISVRVRFLVKAADWNRTSKVIMLSMITSKIGSGESQLRVHPTMGSKRAARSLAKALTASIAVLFSGFLTYGQTLMESK